MNPEPAEQLDLFSGAGAAPECDLGRSDCAGPPPCDLDDPTLIIAIANARQSDCMALAHEAGRRRLSAAVPVLERLCRRLKGFGREHPVREQIAALNGLRMIGGSGAAVAIARIIVDQVVDDPGLPLAVDAAVSLGARLPADMVAALLRHPAPQIRADACRCARGGKEVTELLLNLLNDLNPPVRRQAALALGRLGRDEARPALMRLLHAEPSSDVIEAIAAVADEDCQVLLGRVGCARHHLAAAAIAVLEDLDTPRATSIADMVRKSRAERAS